MSDHEMVTVQCARCDGDMTVAAFMAEASGKVWCSRECSPHLDEDEDWP